MLPVYDQLGSYSLEDLLWLIRVGGNSNVPGVV